MAYASPTLQAPNSNVHDQDRATVIAASLPWYIWCAIAAVTSVMIGAHWDISWHSSIGRDSFWTPAHMAIYLCGLLSGIAFGYLILHTTFRQGSKLRPASVRIWGLHGPLGAFIAAWGGIAMLTSAPFDNWWHDAYGLDVKIVSPPHLVLFLGTYAVLIGTLVLIAGHVNRTIGSAAQLGRVAFLYVCGITLVMLMVLVMEYTSRSQLHQTMPYVALSLLVPPVLGIGSRGSGSGHAATAIAGMYTFILIGFILILPLFPAFPKLGPVYQNVTHFVPPQFPLLLLVPAIALDRFWQHCRRNANLWLVAGVSALIFVFLLLLSEWPFASFLMSAAARNAFFGTTYLYYGLPPTSYLARNLFLPAQTIKSFAGGVGIALILATLSFRFGLGRGNWMSAVKR